MSNDAYRRQQEQEEHQLWDQLREESMFCDENYGDKRIAIPGLSVAGVQFADAPDRIELWDTVDEEIYYGWVPANYSTEQIKAAIRFYRSGYEFAEERARFIIQNKILKALGLFGAADA